MLTKILRELTQIYSGYGVPYVPTSDERLEIILSNLELEEGEVFIDIGCWDGRVLEAVAEKFSGVKCIWYESSQYPYALARERLQKSKQKFEVHNANIFSVSLKEADSIYIYMLPYMLSKLTKKLQKECKIGAKIYVQSHQIKTWIPEKIVPLSQKNNLYIYTIKK